MVHNCMRLPILYLSVLSLHTARGDLVVLQAQILLLHFPGQTIVFIKVY